MTTFIEVPASIRSIKLRKLVYGVGINDAGYITKTATNYCPYYNIWSSMLARCYSPKQQLKQPSYIGCTVCIEWLTFSKFKAWMIQQPWQGNEIDKDVILINNKIYCPDYCAFIPKCINNLFHTSEHTKKSTLPLGVRAYTTNKGTKYRATLRRASLPSIDKGGFLTPEEAHAYYLNAKSGYLMYLASTQQDPRVKAGLLAWASSFL